MFYLLNYVKYHNKFLKKIILGILLAIINNLMNLLLSIISGSLLTYTFLIGIKNNSTYYNYIIPIILIRIIFIIKTITQYFEKIIQHNNTLYLLNNFRILIFNKIFPLYPTNLISIFNIDILNMLISDIEILDFFYIKIFVPIIVIIIITIIVLTYLSIINFIFFIILFVTILFLILFYFFYFYKKGKIIGEKYIFLKEKYFFYINNFILQHTEYKIFEGIKHISFKIKNLELKLENIQLIKNTYNIQSKLLMNILININLLLVLIYYYNSISKYQIILFLLFFITFYKILFPLNNVFQNIHEIFLSAKKIFYLIEKKPTVLFVKNNIKINNYLILLKIDNLSFYFNKRNPYILKNISLYIKKHQKIAITGHNGSGKSTLFMLLTRAWDPVKGKIFLDKYNLKNWDLISLRNNISVMTQKIYLFSDTLKNNILLNNQNNKNINDSYLKKILKLVGLKKLLENEGLNTWMGDGGRLLSGGELKKLGIARIIIHNGNLILLDEPTEGLDENSSFKIIKLILSFFKKKTVIIITHNIHILKKMDYIYLINNGSIIEKGKHNNLINKKEYYWNYIKNNIIL
ncbi:ATP-binding cassette domain-containing protein [Enterobacteriaceae endosymbiont of Donacia cincticornis]|uniref:ATP-binding cassette domain-containing protein n=1 Tax=Enterobacteriaceae endosymbiont of Donacia cincticornis TaxID=2675773 RepID=UPI001449C534|nr:ATP-binding cassette domain-containing protein [Enterobacteriaceae endosymbiont of Donacia cincticornis]QJC36295.1 ATP-binding cassette domain-containing protein [Enterobacteriaceae endosymbiont of Donacia cincticornis]